MKWDRKCPQSDPDAAIEVKISVIGDSFCGKTCLTSRFVQSKCPPSYVPTGFEKYELSTNIASSKFCLSIWDTSGSASYDTVRPLAYKDTTVFLMCFDLGDPESLQRVLNKWFPEVHQSEGCSSTPIILCGCKSDIRRLMSMDTMNSVSSSVGSSLPDKISTTRSVSTGQALDACRQIGAVTYVETSSAEDNNSAIEAFRICALAAKGQLNGGLFSGQLKKSSSCSTLTRCRSILKLRKCKSRADFASRSLDMDSSRKLSVIPMDLDTDGQGSEGSSKDKNCVIM